MVVCGNDAAFQAPVRRVRRSAQAKHQPHVETSGQAPASGLCGWRVRRVRCGCVIAEYRSVEGRVWGNRSRAMSVKRDGPNRDYWRYRDTPTHNTNNSTSQHHSKDRHYYFCLVPSRISKATTATIKAWLSVSHTRIEPLDVISTGPQNTDYVATKQSQHTFLSKS